MEKGGKHFSDEEKAKLLSDIKKSYEEKSEPLYAASKIWIDEIIDPLLTREYVSMALDVANNNPNWEKFNVGILQT
jgi:acetyl-CoA carboxylase carboxyltransferase component